MADDIPQTPSVLSDVTETIQHLQPESHDSETHPDPEKILDQTSKSSPSTRSFFRTARFRFGLAVSGIFAVGAAMWLRRKQRGQPVSACGDQEVEDFTANQQAMLSRVREICNEHITDAEATEKPSGRT
jgi:hypothetical protein